MPAETEEMQPVYPRDADELILPAIRQAISELSLTGADRPAVILAERYATLIDEAACTEDRGWALRWIGPLLLDALQALGVTPAARARISSGKPDDARKPSRVAQLRAARGA